MGEMLPKCRMKARLLAAARALTVDPPVFGQDVMAGLRARFKFSLNSRKAVPCLHLRAGVSFIGPGRGAVLHGSGAPDVVVFNARLGPGLRFRIIAATVFTHPIP